MTATVKPFSPLPYTPKTPPVLPGGVEAYTRRELQRLKETLDTLSLLTPQQAMKAPTRLVDGMLRLSRWPWWPVSGQAKDGWVYYDAAGGHWLYLGSDPTTTH